MIGERMTELLEATAKQLSEGMTPLSHEFLVEHNVTLDEAMSLSQWITACIMTTVDLDQNGGDGGRHLIGMGFARAAMLTS